MDMVPEPCNDREIYHVCHDSILIDLLKLDIQGHEHSALAGAEHSIKTGRLGIIFMELNWAKSAGAKCAAIESIRLLEQAGYRLSRPGKHLNRAKAGDWLRTLSDVVAIEHTHSEVFQPR
jgi:hypothetical protein